MKRSNSNWQWATMAAAAYASLSMTGQAKAQSAMACPMSYSQLKSNLVAADNIDQSGFNNHYWAVVVNRAGVVCQVAYSGPDVGSQWLASRQIAAAKAFTANGLSLNIGTGSGALSTAQLYQFVVPADLNSANPLYGLAGGNVLNSQYAYAGDYNAYGTPSDPMIGTRVGGTITFGGGLALYNGNTVIGALGLSGDTACADHSTAWRIRLAVSMTPPNPTDQLPFSTSGSQQPNGHPHCPNDTFTVGAK